MSEEQFKAFIEKVHGDDNLQAKLKAAANPDAVVSIAKEAGFSISADDLMNAQSEMSEEELEGIAGGVVDEAPLGLSRPGKTQQPPVRAPRLSSSLL
ncbi:Nif11-like leader peptide family natural product precursor [Synechococcus sp. UW179A]|uniref:Nif11-like leader peptide family natural product precursor n=1 Tax=Synechococcus sp. UW179A TaxID=2575510 RepID=UPI000E0F49E6|nr:Nif11-like leader peptide family natural product precursor [Synechococcus sp. UW179A]